MDIYWFLSHLPIFIEKRKRKVGQHFLLILCVGKFFYRKGKPGDSHLKECRPWFDLVDFLSDEIPQRGSVFDRPLSRKQLPTNTNQHQPTPTNNNQQQPTPNQQRTNNNQQQP